MADITLKCTKCEHEFSVSEFINKPTVECVKCGSEIAMPTQTARTKLKLVKRDQPTPEEIEAAQAAQAEEEAGKAGKKKNKSKGKEAAEPPVAVASATGAAAIAERFKNRKSQERKDEKITVTDKVKAVKGSWEWVVFILVGGALVAMQYLIANGNSELSKIYTYAMYALIPITFFGVVISGFGQSKATGMMLLLIPPYWLYYALSGLDQRLMRGIACAVVLALGLELKFRPDQAFINQAQSAMNGWINKGQNTVAQTDSVKTKETFADRRRRMQKEAEERAKKSEANKKKWSTPYNSRNKTPGRS